MDWVHRNPFHCLLHTRFGEKGGRPRMLHIFWPVFIQDSGIPVYMMSIFSNIFRFLFAWIMHSSHKNMAHARPGGGASMVTNPHDIVACQRGGVSNEPHGQRQDTGPGILWSVHRWTRPTWEPPTCGVNQDSTGFYCEPGTLQYIEN